ncbi:MAG: rhodanese-like domain-containing protein [Tepidisphaeraceae bacterium]
MNCFKTLAIATVLGATLCGCAQNSGVSANVDPALPAPAKPYANVDPNQFEALSKRPNTVILDVRSAAEYADGHLPNAVNLDVNSPGFAESAAKLDKSRAYIVHCRSGGRSARACAELSGQGFTTLYNLDGGLTAWIAAGKPVEK